MTAVSVQVHLDNDGTQASDALLLQLREMCGLRRRALDPFVIIDEGKGYRIGGTDVELLAVSCQDNLRLEDGKNSHDFRMVFSVPEGKTATQAVDVLLSFLNDPTYNPAPFQLSIVQR